MPENKTNDEKNEEVKSDVLSPHKSGEELEFSEKEVQEAVQKAEKTWDLTKEKMKNLEGTYLTRELKTLAGKIVIPDLGKRDVLTLALLFKQVDLFVKNRNEETNKTQTNETIPQQNQTTENQPKRPPKNMYR